MHDGKFPKVLVKRHKDTTLVASPRQNRSITRVSGPFAGPDDVVARAAECSGGLARKAGVQQEFHGADAMGNGSHRSCPTSRRANTRQARMSSGSSHG